MKFSFLNVTASRLVTGGCYISSERFLCSALLCTALLCSACQILNQSNKLKSRIILLTNNCEQICGYWPIRGGGGVVDKEKHIIN